MRLPSITLFIASSLSLALAACGDDPSIVATWRELPNALADEIPPVAERTVWTFGDDGTVSMVEDGVTSAATYTLDGDALTLTVVDPNETLTIETTVLVGDDELVYGAIFPEGAVDGAVGTWGGDTTVNDRASRTTLTVRADQTAHMVQVSGTDPETILDGTWAESGDSMMFTFMTDPQTTQRTWVHRQGEEAMGQKMERI